MPVWSDQYIGGLASRLFAFFLLEIQTQRETRTRRPTTPPSMPPMTGAFDFGAAFVRGLGSTSDVAKTLTNREPFSTHHRYYRIVRGTHSKLRMNMYKPVSFSTFLAVMVCWPYGRVMVDMDHRSMGELEPVGVSSRVFNPSTRDPLRSTWTCPLSV